MTELKIPASKAGLWWLLAGTISAIGASACCVLPLILVALGIGSASLGFLTLLEPYRPLFIGTTLLLFAFAFHRIYLAPRACLPRTSCIRPNHLGRQRLAFWVLSALALTLIALPWLLSMFYSR